MDWFPSQKFNLSWKEFDFESKYVDWHIIIRHVYFLPIGTTELYKIINIWHYIEMTRYWQVCKSCDCHFTTEFSFSYWKNNSQKFLHPHSNHCHCQIQCSGLEKTQLSWSAWQITWVTTVRSTCKILLLPMYHTNVHCVWLIMQFATRLL